MAYRLFWCCLAACLGALLLSSCDAPVTFEQDNPSDPGSAAYVPPSPGNVMARAKEGAVEVVWGASSSSAAGYLVEKALEDTTAFEEIGRTDIETPVFVDSTGHYAADTYYRVSTYVEENGELKRREGHQTRLLHGPIEITDLAYGPEGIVEAAWTGERGVATHTALLIQSEDEDFTPVDTIAYEANGDGLHIRTDIASFGFAEVTVRLCGLSQMEEPAFFTYCDERALDTRPAHAPTDLQISFPDESHVRVSWTPASTLEDGFEIAHFTDYSYHVDVDAAYEVIGTVEAGVTEFEGSFSPRNVRQNYFRVYARHGDTRSDPAQDRSFFRREAPVLHVARASIPQNLALTWEDPVGWHAPAHRFFIEARRIGGTEPFETVAELDKGTEEYELRNLDFDEEYLMRIRTEVSPPSDFLSVAYQQLYEEATALEGDPSGLGGYAVVRFTISPSGRKLAAFYRGSTYRDIPSGWRVWDLASGQEIHSQWRYPSQRSPQGVFIGEDELLIAIHTDLFRYDLSTGEDEVLLETEDSIVDLDVRSGEVAVLEQGGRWHRMDLQEEALVATGSAGVGADTYISAIALHPLRPEILAVGGKQAAVLLDSSTQQELQRIDRAIQAFFFDEQGEHLVAQSTVPHRVPTDTTHLFRLHGAELSLEQISQVPGHDPVPLDGRSIEQVSTLYEGDLYLWNLPAGTPLGRTETEVDDRQGGVTLHIHHPDESAIYGLREGTVREWQPAGQRRWMRSLQR